MSAAGAVSSCPSSRVDVHVRVSHQLLHQATPATPWEAELDRLIREQLVTRDEGQRKALYDRVQAIVASELPIICLVSPNILAGAHTGLGNVRPSILPSHTLWNADELYWQSPW